MQISPQRTLATLAQLGRTKLTFHQELAEGQAIVVGDVTVEPIGCGIMLVGVGDLAITINRHAVAGSVVTVYHDWEAMPHVIDNKRPDEPPLCKFGPGGAFVQDYTPQDDSPKATVKIPNPKSQIPSPAAV